jgi:hypothetical protein
MLVAGNGAASKRSAASASTSYFSIRSNGNIGYIDLIFATGTISLQFRIVGK